MTLTTWRLSGFGDEIDPDPRVQLQVLAALGARHIEVRSAWGVNVVDLDDEQLSALQTQIADAGFGVSAIASPVGKVDVAAPVEQELERLDRALRVASALQAPYIRIFSFYRAAPRQPEEIRDAVMRNMGLFAQRAERAGITLVHENEKDIYGDTPGRVLDIVETVGSDHLKVAWDSANFVQVGFAPFTDAYEMLRPHVAYVQIKDALLSTGAVVPAGRGDGQIPELIDALVTDGYSGFVSLEPHLANAHQLGGFSGPEAFNEAAVAFRAICRSSGVALE